MPPFSTVAFGKRLRIGEATSFCRWTYRRSRLAPSWALMVVLSLWGIAVLTQEIRGNWVWVVTNSGPGRASTSKRAQYAAAVVALRIYCLESKQAAFCTRIWWATYCHYGWSRDSKKHRRWALDFHTGDTKFLLYSHPN